MEERRLLYTVTHLSRFTYVQPKASNYRLYSPWYLHFQVAVLHTVRVWTVVVSRTMRSIWGARHRESETGFHGELPPRAMR